jgi:PBSX family phage terminase large subunit
MRVNYFAETFDDVRELVWQPLLRELESIILKKNEALSEIICKNKDGNKTFLKLRSWENVELMRGKKSDFNIYDEVAKYKKFWLYKEEVLRATLSDYIGRELYLSTPRGFNHFYDLYNLESEDSDYKSFHFTSYDNQFLSKSELETAKKQMTEDRFAQEYLADFRKTEGLVYKEFNRDKHLFDEPGFDGEVLQIVKTFGGHDFGTHNPCAAITIKKDKDNNYWVTDEWYKTGKTDAEQADYVAALKWNECYADPESLSGIEEMKRRGVNVRDVIKNKDSIKNGINTVRELFKQGRLYISSGCKNLIWELETYSYPDKKDMHNEEENPIKENDHACDALRYALSMEMIDKKDSINIYHPQGIGLLTQKQNFSVNRPSSGFNKFR